MAGENEGVLVVDVYYRRGRRLRIYRAGGMVCQTNVPNIGWVVDTEDLNEDELLAALQSVKEHANRHIANIEEARGLKPVVTDDIFDDYQGPDNPVKD